MARFIDPLAIVAIVASAGGVCGIAAEPAGGFEHFVSVREAQLYDGDQPLRFVSWNIPNLITVEDSFEFLGETPWRWPDEFEIADALETVRQMGGRVARTYVITVRREDSDMGDDVHVLAPGKFNEEAFVALDRVLQIANEKQVRIILPLVDNWRWMGGIEQYAAFRGKEADAFWTDRQIIEDFKATIHHVVNRRNTLTGRSYRDDKAILGWETGNELDATPQWTAEIAAYLKELDPNHLVIDGRSLHGIPEWSLQDPHVDVVTTHHYPAPGRNIVKQIVAAAKVSHGNKPYFVGEVGFIPVDEAARAFDAVIEHDASGALLWSLRFHRREGGFYWHDEPSGGNLFKAYHWPGFDSGDAYDERRMLQAMTTAAARIQGAEPAKALRPQPAVLLPIEHPGRISWQGSTGASDYDVQRAAAADGPWMTIGRDVSDAAVQYRPLFCDEGVQPGQSYYYRVIAKNEAGAADPSKVLGPVAVDHALLVDEMRTKNKLAGESGPVVVSADRARRTQEDMHRLELGPRGAITYQLSGDVQEIAVWLFAEDSDPPCAILVSTDGAAFEEIRIETKTSRRSAGDYGYLQPVLAQGKVPRPGVRWVQIAHGGDEGAKFQISRVEISHGQIPSAGSR